MQYIYKYAVHVLQGVSIYIYLYTQPSKTFIILIPIESIGIQSVCILQGGTFIYTSNLCMSYYHEKRSLTCSGDGGTAELRRVDDTKAAA